MFCFGVWEGPAEPLTEILDVLIASKLQGDIDGTSLKAPARKVLLVYHDAIGRSGRNERDAIRKLGPAGVVVEGYVGQHIADDGEKQGQVSATGQ